MVHSCHTVIVRYLTFGPCRLIPHRETTGPPLSTCYATLQLSPSESLDRPWDVNKNKGSRYCHLRGFTPCCLIDKKSIFDLINLSNHCCVQFDIQRNIIGWELLIHSFYIQLHALVNISKKRFFFYLVFYLYQF